MRVPKYIKDKMHRVAYLQQQSYLLMMEIEQWLLRNGFTGDDLDNGGFLRCGDGVSLEELEYGEDITALLVKKIEGANATEV